MAPAAEDADQEELEEAQDDAAVDAAEMGFALPAPEGFFPGRGRQPSVAEQVRSCLQPPTWKDSPIRRRLKAPTACPIRNFFFVSPNVLRGGRPSHSFAVLRALGVRTVVNLEDYWSASPWRRDAEKREGEKYGIEVINTPLSPIFRLDQHFVFQTLQLLRDPARRPVFVHCRFGKERTGLLVALDLIVNYGWCPRQAYASMMLYGFRPFLVPALFAQFFVWAAPYCPWDPFTSDDARAGRY